MKKIGLLSVAVLASAFMLAGCQQGNQKTGSVDMVKLMQSPAVKNMGQSMMAQSKGSETQLRAAYQNLQKVSMAAKNAKGADKQAAEAKAKAAQAKFSTMMSSFQQSQKADQQKLRGMINTAIASAAKAKDVSNVYIKQVVLYSANSVDLTADVLSQLQSSGSASTASASAPANTAPAQK